MMFSIHTMELKRKVTKDEFWEIQRFYADDSLVNKYPAYLDKNDYVVEKYTKSNGITIKLRVNEKGHSILLIINPRNINGADERLEIYNPDSIEPADFILKLYDLIQQEPLGSVDDFIIRRLDLCINLELETQEQINAYMTLISRSRAPYPLTKNFYIENRKRDIHGVYFNGRGYGIYVYEKIYQIRRKSRCMALNSDLDRKIIRFEIRLTRDRIRRIEVEYGNANLFMIVAVIKHISFDFFRYIIPRTFLSGKYYHLEGALEKVQKSDFYSKTKEEMKLLLHETCKRQDLESSLSYLADVYSWNDNKIRGLLRQYDEIDVNPLCLPQRCPLMLLPSIPDLMGLKKEAE